MIILITLASVGIYIVLIPKFRGIRGQPRYTAFRSVPGLWLCGVALLTAASIASTIAMVKSDALRLADTYYYVMHFNTVATMVLMTIGLAYFILFFETIVRATYHPGVAVLQCCLWIIGMALIFMPTLIMELTGQGRRTQLSPDNYEIPLQFTAIGVGVTLLSLAVLGALVIDARLRKRPMTDRSATL